MDRPTDRTPLLSYRSALDEPAPPAVEQVFGGLVYTALGVFFLLLAGALLVLATTARPVFREPLRFVPLFVAAGLFVVPAIIMFSRAHRLFRGRSPEDRSFTFRCRRALALANAEALAQGSASVDGDHLLLGLLSCGPSTALVALANLNVDVDQLRTAVNGNRPAAPAASDALVLPATATCGRIISRAVQLAYSQDAEPVGTEHLLLALLRESATTARRALEEAGVTDTAVMAQVERQRAAAPDGMTPEVMELSDVDVAG